MKQTFTSQWNKIIHLFFGERRISCTPGHKFWLPEKGKYLSADSLMKGVKVLTLAVGLMSLDSVAYADTNYTAYNFEVDDHHNYFVGEDEILVHNHCALPAANISLDEIEDFFPIAQFPNRDELIQQLGKDMMPQGSNGVPSALFSYIKNAPTKVERVKRVRAWWILNEAGRFLLKLNPEFLAKVIRCIDHPQLLSIGIDQQFLVEIAKSLSGDFSQAGKKIFIEGIEKNLTTSMAKILEDEIFDVIYDFGNAIENNAPANFGNLSVDVLSKLKGSQYSARKGAVGVLKFLTDPETVIVGKNVSFEVKVSNARGTNSYIDVIINTVRTEVKNCKDCVTSLTIREQFIQRDLYNANSIENISKWKIFEQNYTKVNFINHLNNNKDAIENLGMQKLSELIDDDISDLTISQSAEMLIGSISDNFSTIFK